MDTLQIIPVEAGPVATVGYCILDNAEKKAAVIDVPKDSAAIFLDIAHKYDVQIESIFLTHSHWDHVADLAPLHRATQAPVYIHPDDEYRLLAPMNYTIWPLPFTIEAVTENKYYRHGDRVKAGRWDFDIVHTPGHTEGGICLIDRQMKTAFVGDTLFNGSIGRTDLPGGEMETLLESIRLHLLSLEDQVRIFPGHGPSSTIGAERLSNPFLINT